MKVVVGFMTSNPPRRGGSTSRALPSSPGDGLPLRDGKGDSIKDIQPPPPPPGGGWRLDVTQSPVTCAINTTWLTNVCVNEENAAFGCVWVTVVNLASCCVQEVILSSKYCGLNCCVLRGASSRQALNYHCDLHTCVVKYPLGKLDVLLFDGQPSFLGVRIISETWANLRKSTNHDLSLKMRPPQVVLSAYQIDLQCSVVRWISGTTANRTLPQYCEWVTLRRALFQQDNLVMHV